MEIKSYLDNFRAQFEPALEDFLDSELARFKNLDPIGGVVARAISDFTLHRGKRIRAALTKLGYEATGLKPDRTILQPAIAVELLHSFLLIHDDIIDQSALRRGKPTVHEYFAAQYGKSFHLRSKIAQQLGSFLGILAGDVSFSLALRALSTSKFPMGRIKKATHALLETVDTTITGQALDIMLPFSPHVRETQVLKTLRLKTANYSVLAPLRLGMILAGARAPLLKQIEQYAIPVGMAFQIQDDILGVFGSKKELGKPVISDLEEGKQTVLTSFVEQHGSAADRRTLRSVLGRPGLRFADLKKIRVLFRQTRALWYSQKRAREHVSEAQQSLEKISIPRKVSQLLREVAEFVVDRTV